MAIVFLALGALWALVGVQQAGGDEAVHLMGASRLFFRDAFVVAAPVARVVFTRGSWLARFPVHRAGGDEAGHRLGAGPVLFGEAAEAARAVAVVCGALKPFWARFC